MTIDGYSQPGTSPNTNTLAQGDNAVLLIELDGTSSGGLSIKADETKVRGLVINGGFDKIRISASNVVIEGNFLGVDPTGALAKRESFSGLGIRQNTTFITETANDNTIGGATDAARNVISGNGSGGIIIEDGNATDISGNYIVPNTAGTAALTRDDGSLIQDEGIQVNNTPDFEDVPTNTKIDGNLISGDSREGIISASGGVIHGNLIGTQRDGSSPLGNGQSGIILENNEEVTVGGTGSGEGNIIAFNRNVGVGVRTNSSKKGILGNSIYF